MRVPIDRDPFADRADTARPLWRDVFVWPARWIHPPEPPAPPLVVAYRCRVELPSARTVRLHVSADERYELFLDGARVGRGPERGDAANWFFETYDLDLSGGEHMLVARVWSLGPDLAPAAQVSVEHGLLVCPQEEELLESLATGTAPWECRVLEGYSFSVPSRAGLSGARVQIDGARCAWGVERGEGEGWVAAEAGPPGVDGEHSRYGVPGHGLKPAPLPPMLEEPRHAGRAVYVDEPACAETGEVRMTAENDLPEEHAAWTTLCRGEGAVTVPAASRRRALIDLEDYYCAYPEVLLSGGAGARVRVLWEEACYDAPRPGDGAKGQRDEFLGRYFHGLGDTFLPDGGERRRFEPLWWRAGRYVEIFVETAEEPLTLERFGLRETRYPLEMESEFEADDGRLNGIVPIMVRGLQMCSHETYMDCPFYEQLMYVGDTRLEVLATYAISRDKRLPRKAIRMFDASRIPEGLTACSYPSRGKALIAPFSLWWVAMLYDYAFWRDDLEFVRRMMPGARAVADYFLGCRNADGLVEAPRGWNYMDWVRDEEWHTGTPPDGQWGVSGMINWQFTLALTLLSELEDAVGEHELASRAGRLAGDQTDRCHEAFWDEERGLYTDTLDGRCASEHTQCLALLSDMLPQERAARVADALMSEPDLFRTTIYFSHYLLDALGHVGRMDAFFKRLEEWFALPEWGFKTTYEVSADSTRSDCHAWGAHPLWHYFATVLGIRPAAPGFRRVSIRPQMGPLRRARGRLPHPAGTIEVELQAEDGRVTGEVTLPDGVEGEFNASGRAKDLAPGHQQVG